MNEPKLPPLGPHATPYVYRDADGNAVFMAIRVDKPEGGKSFSQWHIEKGQWIKGGMQNKPLWNLPLIVGTPNAKILVVEGEKTARAAGQYLPDGWIVTTWAGGSNAINGTNWEPLKGRIVAIWPDNDVPGSQAADKIQKLLDGARIIIPPTGLPEGWDLADELPQGLIPADLIEPPPPKPAPAAPSTIPSADYLQELATLDPVSYGQRRKEAARALGISCALLDKAVARERPKALSAAAIDWVTGTDGSIQPIFANAAALLNASQEKWPLRFDEFSFRPFLGHEPLRDDHLLSITDWVQRNGVICNKRITDDAAIHVANNHRFHEVRDWLQHLSWDGISRIDMLLVDHAGAADSPLVRAMTSRWLIQAVARVMQPGCQADATLILEGRQDLGKSSLFRALFGDRWFTDHLPNLDNKDAMLQLLGIWCVEIAELATLDRSENSKIKQFLTSRVDRFRLPWDKLASDHPRQSVFCGTVNPGAAGYLKDETGGRRFWPVQVNDINVPMILENREQFWAEAVARYNAGEIWYLDDDQLKASAQELQEERYIGDPWLEPIERFVNSKDEVTSEAIFADCLNITSKADWRQADFNRIARCMAVLKWGRKQKRLDGKRRWVYTRPPGAEKPHPELPLDAPPLPQHWDEIPELDTV